MSGDTRRSNAQNEDYVMTRILYIVMIAVFTFPHFLTPAPLQAEGLKPDSEVLFVQTAGAMKSTGDSLTLSNISAELVWMTERPYRQSGQISNQDFLEAWSEGDDSFNADPPNAVLTLKENIEKPIFLEITNPRFRGDQVTYDINILAGLLPPSSGQVSMLIDSRVMRVNSQITDF